MRNPSVVSPGALVLVFATWSVPSAHAAPAADAGESDPLRDTTTDCPPRLEILVERSFAQSEGLATGDRVPLSTAPDGPTCPATVAGIYEPRADPTQLTTERPRLVFHLPQLQRLLGRDAEVDRFSIRLVDDADPSSEGGRLARQLPGTQVVPTEEVIGESSTTFEVVRRFHGAIGAITLVAGGAFLACIMILKVQERRASIAALRLIGTSHRTLASWLFLETAVVSTLGGIMGIGVGKLASVVINRYYQRAYDTNLVFSLVTPEIVAQSLVLALGLGLVAGGVATLRLLDLDALQEVGR